MILLSKYLETDFVPTVLLSFSTHYYYRAHTEILGLLAVGLGSLQLAWRSLNFLIRLITNDGGVAESTFTPACTVFFHITCSCDCIFHVGSQPCSSYSLYYRAINHRVIALHFKLHSYKFIRNRSYFQSLLFPSGASQPLLKSERARKVQKGILYPCFADPPLLLDPFQSHLLNKCPFVGHNT